MLRNDCELILDDLLGNRRVYSVDKHDIDSPILLGRGMKDVDKSFFFIGEDDPWMHRMLMQFWWAGESWIMHNSGSRMMLTIAPLYRRIGGIMKLSPGSKTLVPYGSYAITCSTPERDYEFHMAVHRKGRDWLRPPAVEIEAGDETREYSTRLRQEQLELLSVLVAPMLIGPGRDISDVPGVSEIAAILNWTQKKVETKMSRLVDELAREGVPDFVKYQTKKSLPKKVLLARFAWDYYEVLGLHKFNQDKKIDDARI